MEQPKDIGTKTDLYRQRLDSAKEALDSAKLLMNANSYRAANNRAYYAIFHAINAVYALNGVAYKRHKDALANFNKEYVKAEIFPRALERKIGMAEDIRHASDYDDFYIAIKSEVEEMVETAEELINAVEKYFEKQN